MDLNPLFPKWTKKERSSMPSVQTPQIFDWIAKILSINHPLNRFWLWIHSLRQPNLRMEWIFWRRIHCTIDTWCLGSSSGPLKSISRESFITSWRSVQFRIESHFGALIRKDLFLSNLLLHIIYNLIFFYFLIGYSG